MPSDIRPALKVSAIWLLTLMLVVSWAIQERRRGAEAERGLSVAKTELEHARAETQPAMPAPPMTNALSKLAHENAALREKLAALELLAGDNDALKRENADLKRAATTPAKPLDSGPESKRPAPAQISEISGPQASDATIPQDKFEAHLCYAHLQQINLAATSWAEANNGLAATNFFQLQELLSPMILVCPSARPKSLARRWQDLDPSTITYRLTWRGFQHRDGVSQWGPQAAHWVFAQCPIHEIPAFNQRGMLGMPSKYSR